MAVTLHGHAGRGRATAAVFLDKDGTLVKDVPYNVDPERVEFTPYALEGLRLLVARGYSLIVVTNQPGLALERFDLAALERLRTALAGRMAQGGAPMTAFYVCPHAPSSSPIKAGCRCRKPAPGLLRRAAREHHLELERSWMVGDILDDVEAGRRAGCRSVLLDVGNETQWQLTSWRRPTLRATNLLEAAHLILAAYGSAQADDAALGSGARG